MLTKSDLTKIGQVVNQAVKPIKQDIGVLKTDVGILKQDVSVLKQDISGLKKDTKKIKNTLDDFIDFFDKNELDHEKRISRIENNLKLSHPSVFV